jgi:nucleotide-binding universal stress UspA family protein
MKALVAIDGSENALRALRYVTEHADFFSANPEVVLVNVHLPLPSRRARAVLGSEAIEQYYKEESEEVLVPARALLAGKPCRVSELSLVGQPAAEIIAAAQKHHCDVIVMGTQSRSALGNFLVGSVAMRVISESPIPVLSVK